MYGYLLRLLHRVTLCNYTGIRHLLAPVHFMVLLQHKTEFTLDLLVNQFQLRLWVYGTR